MIETLIYAALALVLLAACWFALRWAAIGGPLRRARRRCIELGASVPLEDVEAAADAALALGPLTHDICATCSKPLHENERVEVLVGDVEFSDEYGGNTAVLVAYCQEHKP